MGSTFIEVNEVPAASPYNNNNAEASPAKRADTFSRSLQNTPGGVTTDAQGKTTANLSTETNVAPPAGREGDILRSARSKHGGPVSQITDESVVTINGVTCTVASATKAGLITKRADGSYGEVSKQAPAQAQQRQRVDPLSHDSRSGVQAIENIVGKQNADAFMNKLASACGHGRGIKGVQRELADLGGIQPEASEAIATRVVRDLENKIARTLIQDNGINEYQAEECMAWCFENLPNAHVSAIFQGALHGSRDAARVAFEKFRLSGRKANNN
jgi:hypothetical protein